MDWSLEPQWYSNGCESWPMMVLIIWSSLVPRSWTASRGTQSGSTSSSGICTDSSPFMKCSPPEEVTGERRHGLKYATWVHAWISRFLFFSVPSRQQDLFSVLKAYTLHRPEEGYCQAQAPIAAVLLMHMPAEVQGHMASFPSFSRYNNHGGFQFRTQRW